MIMIKVLGLKFNRGILIVGIVKKNMNRKNQYKKESIKKLFFGGIKAKRDEVGIIDPKANNITTADDMFFFLYRIGKKNKKGHKNNHERK
jgi:hypothetical protein